MAHGAVQADLVHPKTPSPRNSYRQIVAGLDHEAERREPAGKLVATDGWQRLEDPIWRERTADRLQQGHARLAADRAVLEVLRDRVVSNRAVRPQRRNDPDGDEARNRQRGDRGAADDPPDAARVHTYADGWKTDITCCSISSRLAKRLSS